VVVGGEVSEERRSNREGETREREEHRVSFNPPSTTEAVWVVVEDLGVFAPEHNSLLN